MDTKAWKVSIKLSEILSESVLARSLVSDHKPLASWLPFKFFVSLLASPWLPIVRSQMFENGRQGMESFNKIE